MMSVGVFWRLAGMLHLSSSSAGMLHLKVDTSGDSHGRTQTDAFPLVPAVMFSFVRWHHCWLAVSLLRAVYQVTHLAALHYISYL